MALLKYCHDDLVSIMWPVSVINQSKFLLTVCVFVYQVKLPFEKLIHALKNFPEDAMNPDTLLPLAYSIKVLSFLCFSIFFKFYWPKNICSPVCHRDYEWYASLLSFLHFITLTCILNNLTIVMSITLKSLIYWFGWSSDDNHSIDTISKVGLDPK